MDDQRILIERDHAAGIARITFNNESQLNSYDAAMRDQLGRYLDEIAADDDFKVVLLRGAGGVFSTGASMENAYKWYGADEVKSKRRPSQRRRLTVDRQIFRFYHDFMGYPKVTVAEVSGYALGGGFELALMADIAVVARDTKLGMPATRFLGPALGSLQMFFYRLGPVLARRLLLTGDIVAAETLETAGIFTEMVDASAVADRADYWARRAAKMPADGIVIAKEAFRLVEQLLAYHGEEITSYLFHSFGTNLQFEEGEFNFVKTRAQHGKRKAFEMRDAHFDVPEVES